MSWLIGLALVVAGFVLVGYAEMKEQEKVQKEVFNNAAEYRRRRTTPFTATVFILGTICVVIGTLLIAILL